MLTSKLKLLPVKVQTDASRGGYKPVLSKGELQKIVALYLSDTRGFSFNTIEKGLENTNIIISKNNQKYVLRISGQRRRGFYKKRGAKKLTRELNFMDYLYRRGMPVPRIILNNQGNFYFRFRRNGQVFYVAMFEFIDGEEIVRFSEARIRQLAKYSAQAHVMAASYKETSHKDNEALFYFYWWNGMRITYPELLDKHYAHKLNEIINQCHLYINEANVAGLKKYLIHGDLHPGNLLYKGSVLNGVIDFDNLKFAPIAYDIGSCIESVWMHGGYQAKIKKTRIFFDEYIKHRKLSKKDIIYSLYFALERHYVYLSFELITKQKNLTKADLKKYFSRIDEFEIYRRVIAVYSEPLIPKSSL